MYSNQNSLETKSNNATLNVYPLAVKEKVALSSRIHFPPYALLWATRIPMEAATLRPTYLTKMPEY